MRKNLEMLEVGFAQTNLESNIDNAYYTLGSSKKNRTYKELFVTVRT